MPYLAMQDGTKIYYEDQGMGEVLLFVHGLQSSHLKIMPFINEFKGQYRCICYDHRGHEASDMAQKHLNVRTLGQDLHTLIEYLGVSEITAIGHSMGAATIFSYVNQFGCSKLKRIVSVDMTPYMRNTVWEGGIGQGKWTDEDFMQDLDRIFDDIGNANWHISKELMNPALAKTPDAFVGFMQATFGIGCNPLTMAAFWYSLFRTDQRPVMDKITVPFLYIMPECPLYSMVTANYIKEHVKGGFELDNQFPGTTHTILMESPHAVAESIKRFMLKYK